MKEEFSHEEVKSLTIFGLSTCFSENLCNQCLSALPGEAALSGVRVSTHRTAFPIRIYGSYQASVFQILKSKLLLWFLITSKLTFCKEARKPLLKSSLVSQLPRSPFAVFLQVSVIPGAWTGGNVSTQMSVTARLAGGESTATNVSTSTPIKQIVLISPVDTILQPFNTKNQHRICFANFSSLMEQF